MEGRDQTDVREPDAPKRFKRGCTWQTGCFVALSLPLLALFVFLMWLEITPRQYVLQDFDLGTGRVMRIYTNRWGVHGLYCEFLDNDVIAQPMYYFDTALELADVDFETLSALDGDLVAVVDASDPHIILLFFHFPTATSWPTGSKMGTEDRQRWINILREAHPERDLIASWEVRGHRIR